MYEVEVKVRADHGPVRERLRELDAEPLGAVEQVDTYYDHPARSFAETDEALRVRRERPTGESVDDPDERVVLTYKGPLVDDRSKTRAEVETAVDDGDAIDGVLAGIGFDAAAVVRKHRDRYVVDGYAVTLDRVDGLGEFVEVEADGAEDRIPALRDGARELVVRLGLDPDEQVRTSYLELLAADGP